MVKGLPSYEEVVEEALEVFKQYDTALTLRQLYYRLVSKHLFPNTINSYKRLSRLMVKAREQRKVPVNCLEDRSRRILGRGDTGFTSAEEFLKRRITGLRESYKEFRLPMWVDQPNHLLVSLEKDALSRLVSDIANQYAVRTFPTRGYPSFTYVQRMASYMRKRLGGKPIVVLYFGDFDPSGIDIERDLSDRLSKYDAGNFTVKRVALTEDQITKHDLPPMPVKTSDARSDAFLEAYGNKSVELDALDPNILKFMVAESISTHIDLDTWTMREAEIEKLKLWIKQKLENMEDLISD
ncbi:MAG: hypothetical protein QGG23_07755 [Candidatus Bathyarchaeota archaeon]|jgi:hypothetical protein|nr:hypothetical protein [Candidatus Bathyarchaeota archaeon]MDP7207558.1 hypothetical protein [Candidatus Bathyarchaeota archaeon]|tara:strand:- start:1977 stop:2864 length:888 start_codon:yes stop_codon:yes gene_type:complete